MESKTRAVLVCGIGKPASYSRCRGQYPELLLIAPVALLHVRRNAYGRVQDVGPLDVPRCHCAWSKSNTSQLQSAAIYVRPKRQGWKRPAALAVLARKPWKLQGREAFSLAHPRECGHPAAKSHMTRQTLRNSLMLTNIGRLTASAVFLQGLTRFDHEPCSIRITLASLSKLPQAQST